MSQLFSGKDIEACFLHRVLQKMRRVPQEAFLSTECLFRTVGGGFRYRISQTPERSRVSPASNAKNGQKGEGLSYIACLWKRGRWIHRIILKKPAFIVGCGLWSWRTGEAIAQRNYKYIVPIDYPRFDNISFLMPIFLDGAYSASPDFALVLQTDRGNKLYKNDTWFRSGVSRC